MERLGAQALPQEAIIPQSNIKQFIYLWHMYVPNTALRAFVLATDEESARTELRKNFSIINEPKLKWHCDDFVIVDSCPSVVCLVRGGVISAPTNGCVNTTPQ